MRTERWKIDRSHSSLGFSVRHLMMTRVHGSFTRWSGTVIVPDGDFSRATVSVTIDASSIDTGLAIRDADLKSRHIFDAAHFPELLFVGKRVEARSADAMDVIGDLTIKGTTREIVLGVERRQAGKDPGGGQRAVFTAATVINRRDFGLTWNEVLEAGGVLVGDYVEIEAEVQAVRQAEAQVA